MAYIWQISARNTRWVGILLIPVVKKNRMWHNAEHTCYQIGNSFYLVLLIKTIHIPKFGICVVTCACVWCVYFNFFHVWQFLPVERGTLQSLHLVFHLSSKIHPYRIHPLKVTDIKRTKFTKITANKTPVCSLFTARWQVRGSNAFWVLPVGENEHVQLKTFRIYKM